jgi:hypothetical protein
MGGDFMNFDNTPRIQAVQRILAEVEANDAQYLSGEIDRTKWMEVGKSADERLAVAGLRLAIRPWQTASR